jgi:protoporphyrin/coproporphyrin ferrochelatase
MNTNGEIKRALLLINVGTPDRPEKQSVRRYLREFLNDPLVIDLPALQRYLLVNGIIIPFRVRKSTRLYRKVWTNKGSPLLLHMLRLQQVLNDDPNRKFETHVAMRYGNPGLPEVLSRMESLGYHKITLLPVFPHYASATTETSVKRAMEIINSWKQKPETEVIEQFYDHPAFLEAFAANIARHDLSTAEHVIFSYHGLPLRQINNVHPEIGESRCSCTEAMPVHGKKCYKATCYETTRLLAAKAGIAPGKCTTAFQSRLTKNWLAPTTEEVIEQLAARGIKRLLVVAPAFTADCLETVVEIGMDYRTLFLNNGGLQFDWVESLNSEPLWAEAIGRIVNY